MENLLLSEIQEINFYNIYKYSSNERQMPLVLMGLLQFNVGITSYKI